MATLNAKNRTVFEGDNLDILRGLNNECVDLVYLDPPFNSDRNYAAPIGSQAAGAAFKDTWSLSDVDNAWHGEIADREPALYGAIAASEITHSKSMKSYLITMAVRLLEIRRVIKDTGSIYLHCDPNASHYLKTVMDAVFGRSNFRNEIVWHYRRWTGKANRFQRLHDIILFYSKTADYNFNVLYTAYTGKSLKRKQNYHTRTKDGEAYNTTTNKKGVRENDVWTIPILNSQSKERTGYPTQKPLALLDRIIQASSNLGDVVLDPFCGCATTCIAAERLNRQWIGIDLSPKAVELVKHRIEQDIGVYEYAQGFIGQIIHRTDIPKRTDMGKMLNYRTHKHHLYGIQEGICNGCKIHFPFKNLTIDHIIPLTKGGTHHRDNLQLLCGWCNSMKGGGSQEEFVAKMAK